MGDQEQKLDPSTHIYNVTATGAKWGNYVDLEIKFGIVISLVQFFEDDAAVFGAAGVGLVGGDWFGEAETFGCQS